jgi:hypothetical protein
LEIIDLLPWESRGIAAPFMLAVVVLTTVRATAHEIACVRLSFDYDAVSTTSGSSSSDNAPVDRPFLAWPPPFICLVNKQFDRSCDEKPPFQT